MASVFLSYARQDAARVRPIVAALEDAGHAVWWDERIPGGDQFADAIERALESADIVVVLWSSTSVRSAWVRDEAATARDSGRLIPATLDGTQPPLGFRQFQTLDLSKKGAANLKGIDALGNAIASRVGGARPESKAAAARAWPNRSRMLAGAGAIVLLIGLALAFRLLAPASASAAVIPKVMLGTFAALTPNVPEHLRQTMNEEILTAFGTEHEVSLITGNGHDAPFVLDGSIQNSHDALRFTVNLRNKRTGGVIWSHSFDRVLEDSLAPRQVAVAATQVVRCGIWGASAYKKPMSDQGLSLYVDWCNEYWGGSPDEDRMLDAARRVAAALPDFSFAWSAVALSAVPISHRAGSADAASVGREGWEAAEKSIRIDPKNPEGYMAESGLLPSNKLAEREKLLRKAISVRPTECGCERQAYGDFLTAIGRNEEAVEQYDRARAMMPLAPMSNVRLAQALLLTGRANDAREVISRMLEVWPDAEIVRLLQVKSALWTRQYADAARLLGTPELHLVDVERQALLHSFEALQTKDPAATAKAVAELRALAADPRRNDRLVVGALAALKAYDEAVAAAGALIRSRGAALADVLFEPNFAAARMQPSYAALVEQLGLAQYWRSSRELPDICRSTEKPLFCISARKDRQ
jgi:tetratricopeptide (TPR) repeat protein